MSEINNININISLNTLPLSQKGFGLPLIVGTTQPSNLDLVGAINNVAGYSLDDDTIAVDGFADSANPIAEGDKFTIAGETGSPEHTVVSTTKTGGVTTEILFTPALAGAVSDDAVVTVVKETQDVYVEVTDADDLLQLGYGSSDAEYKMAQTMFSQSPRIEKLAVCYIPSFSELATKIAELRNSGKDAWYYLLITSRAKADIAIADTYINTLEKIGVFASSDQTITSSGERTMIFITNKTSEYPDAAMVGKVAGEQVGQVSWDSKQLNGITNSNVTVSEQSTLLAANFNLIREMGGVDVSWEGKTMSGQYIDSIISKDYLKARFIEALQSLKINNKKVPFDNRGIGMTEASMRNVFDDAGLNGVIKPVLVEDDRQYSDLGKYQYVLTLPGSISEISTANRSNRIISPIKFTAKLSGSINTFVINGSLEV
ncbi:MAG: DUF3383 family protein [Leptospiraceae bacterium]|nr:DUF3383 family protein [Leptospiraceae bacterium]